MLKNCLIVVVVITLAGCASLQSTSPQLSVAFKIGESTPSEELTERTVLDSEQKVYLHNKAVLTNAHIASAKVTKSVVDRPEILIVFTKEGRATFAKVTRENINKPLAIIVDNELICAPIIRTEITGGKASITGSFTEEEANRIAKGIMGK
jgi:preprotein translocase subunit SecD